MKKFVLLFLVWPSFLFAQTVVSGNGAVKGTANIQTVQSSGGSVAAPLSLTLTESAGIARTATTDIVTSGVPNATSDTTHWALFQGSTEVPVQVTSLSGPDSWFLVDFEPPNLTANQSLPYTLKNQSPTVSVTNPIVVTDNGTTVEMNNGILDWQFTKGSGFNLFNFVKLNGVTIANSQANAISVIFSNGTTYSAGTPTSVTATVCGQIRCQYEIKGTFSGFPNGGFGYTIRLTMLANSSQGRIEFTLRNSLQSNERHVHLNDAYLLIGGSTDVVRTSSRTGAINGYSYVQANGLKFTLVRSADVSNGGMYVADLNYKRGTVLIDFANPGNTEITRQVTAAQSPLMSIAACSWYQSQGDFSYGNNWACLADEQNLYNNVWNLTFSGSDVPSDPNNPGYALDYFNVDVHTDTEADDLYQNFLMYLRTNGSPGYLSRAIAFANYYKDMYTLRCDGFAYAWNGGFEGSPVSRSDISTGLTSGDTTERANWDTGHIDIVGSNDFGADHMYGIGLLDWYHLTGDPDALSAVTNLGQVVDRVLLKFNTTGDPLFYSLRLGSRQWLLSERMSQFGLGNGTSASTQYAGLVQNNATFSTFQTAPSIGMYYSRGADGSNPLACTNQTNREVGTFQVVFLAQALYRYFLNRPTQTWARDKIISMANFIDYYGVDRQGRQPSAFWLDCKSTGDVGYQGSSPNYTPDLGDVDAIAYRLDGAEGHLTYGKTRHERGICEIFKSITTPGNAVCEFINKTFLGTTFYYNNGHLLNSQFLLHDMLDGSNIPYTGLNASAPGKYYVLSTANVGHDTYIQGASKNLCDPAQVGSGAQTPCPGSVTNTWDGAIPDTKRNRLYFVGNGGHVDYFGNETYVIDLGTSIAASINSYRITNSTTPDFRSLPACNANDNGVLPLGGTVAGGGLPNAAHTYGLTDYSTDTDTGFLFGGVAGGSGCASGHAWTIPMASYAGNTIVANAAINLDTITTGWFTGFNYGSADYDPKKKLHYLNTFDQSPTDAKFIHSYNPATTTWTGFGGSLSVPYNGSSALDWKDGLWVFFTGGQITQFDVNNSMAKTINSTAAACSGAKTSWKDALTYDPYYGVIVIWTPEDQTHLYLYNPTATSTLTRMGTVPANDCLQLTIATNTPPVPSPDNGMYKKGAFFPLKDVIIYFPDGGQNAVALRIR